jgi:release factor glutamine methyltransferase
MPCIEDLLSGGTGLLASKGIATPALDAALLLAEITGLSREKLYIHANKEVSVEQYKQYFELLERRQNGECTAYITGCKEFWGLAFFVTPAVLVPRPDTEILVETALAMLRPLAAASVLDLCTGCGAVAIALKHESYNTSMPGSSFHELDVWASDISEKALEIARYNADRLNCIITFLQGDLFGALKDTKGKRFHLITANAPYVPSGRIENLAAEVRHEPRLALDGGIDGLAVISRIIKEAPQYLEAGGTLLLEADPLQMVAIALLMKERCFRQIKMYRDYNGQKRAIAGVCAQTRQGTSVSK